ncbi:MAG: hypothetical protein CMK46_06910 [Porticoccus sp.]|nr:hypothetical protein [Porticoccus sp.]QDP49892.1 MAG: hypothetical protein GOVbin132_36 [Prokaryotic dsDNA virus sp.]
MVTHVWDHFHELSNQRHSGPEPLSWGEIESWSRLTGTPVSNDEVSMLIAMDSAYRHAVSNEQSSNRKQAQPEPKGGR